MQIIELKNNILTVVFLKLFMVFCSNFSVSTTPVGEFNSEAIGEVSSGNLTIGDDAGESSSSTRFSKDLFMCIKLLGRLLFMSFKLFLKSTKSLRILLAFKSDTKRSLEVLLLDEDLLTRVVVVVVLLWVFVCN